LIQINHLLSVAFSIRQVLAAKEFGLAVDVDGSPGVTHDLLRLGFSKYPLFIASHNSMEK